MRNNASQYQRGQQYRTLSIVIHPLSPPLWYCKKAVQLYKFMCSAMNDDYVKIKN